MKGVVPLKISCSSQPSEIGCSSEKELPLFRRDVTSTHRIIGVDIERLKPGRPFADLARMAFGPMENAEVARSGEPAFYRIWTAREALAKAPPQTATNGELKLKWPAPPASRDCESKES